MSVKRVNKKTRDCPKTDARGVKIWGEYVGIQDERKNPVERKSAATPCRATALLQLFFCFASVGAIRSIRSPLRRGVPSGQTALVNFPSLCRKGKYIGGFRLFLFFLSSFFIQISQVVTRNKGLLQPFQSFVSVRAVISGYLPEAGSRHLVP